MTLPPNRIEAAARALAENDENDWAELSAAVHKSYRGHARAALTAAYPELANGTAWVAPMQANLDMWNAARDAMDEFTTDPMTAMRDAFLQEPKEPEPE